MFIICGIHHLFILSCALCNLVMSLPIMRWKSPRFESVESGSHVSLDGGGVRKGIMSLLCESCAPGTLFRQSGHSDGQIAPPAPSQCVSLCLARTLI